MAFALIASRSPALQASQQAILASQWQWGEAGPVPERAPPDDENSGGLFAGGFFLARRRQELIDAGLPLDAAIARAHLELNVKRDPSSALIDGVRYQRMGPLLPNGIYLNGGPAALHASYVTFHPVYGNVAPWDIWQPRAAAWARSQEPGGFSGFWSDWGVAIVSLAFGGAVAAAESGAVAGASATVAEESALTVAAPVVETTPVVVSEFSLAGPGSGLGIGGQSYGLGLSTEAAGIGLQVPAGSASLLAPALTNPLTYSAPAGIFGSGQVGTVKTVTDAAKPLLALGSAVRSLLSGDAERAPGSSESSQPGVGLHPGIAWTVGLAVVGLIFWGIARG